MNFRIPANTKTETFLNFLTRNCPVSYTFLYNNKLLEFCMSVCDVTFLNKRNVVKKPFVFFCCKLHRRMTYKGQGHACYLTHKK